MDYISPQVKSADSPAPQELVPYEDFRTGLTFQDVRLELAGEQEQERRRGRYMFVSRGTVLGRLRQHKLGAYERYERAARRGRA